MIHGFLSGDMALSAKTGRIDPNSVLTGVTTNYFRPCWSPWKVLP